MAIESTLLEIGIDSHSVVDHFLYTLWEIRDGTHSE